MSIPPRTPFDFALNIIANGLAATRDSLGNLFNTRTATAEAEKDRKFQAGQAELNRGQAALDRNQQQSQFDLQLAFNRDGANRSRVAESLATLDNSLPYLTGVERQNALNARATLQGGLALTGDALEKFVADSATKTAPITTKAQTPSNLPASLDPQATATQQGQVLPTSMLVGQALAASGQEIRAREIADREDTQSFEISKDRLASLNDLYLQNDKQGYEKEALAIAQEYNLSTLEVQQRQRIEYLNAENEINTTSKEQAGFDITVDNLEAGVLAGDVNLLAGSTRDQLKAIIENPNTLETTRIKARGLLTLENPDVLEKTFELKRQDINQRYEQDEALRGKALEQVDQEIELAKRQIMVGDNTIQLGLIETDSARIALERQQFEKGIYQATSIVDIVQKAVSNGDKHFIQKLIENKASQGRNYPELSDIASQVSEDELTDHLKVASEVDNLNQGTRGLAAKQIEADVINLAITGEISKLNLVSNLSTIYSPDEILNLGQTNRGIKTLMDAGHLSAVDLRAASNLAGFRETLQTQEADAPIVERYYQNLESVYLLPPAPGQEQAHKEGLRATLESLVSMGYMPETAVDGVVDAYRNAWANANDQMALDNALKSAQVEMTRASAMKALTGGGSSSGSGSGDGEDGFNGGASTGQKRYFDMLVSANASRLDGIKERYRGCFGADGAFSDTATIEGISCSNYTLEVASSQAAFEADMQSIGLSNKVSDMEVYKFDSLKTVGAEYAKDDPRFKALSDEEILANDGPAEQIALELNAGTYFTTLGVKDGGTGEVTPVDTASIAVTSSSTNSIGDNTNPYGIIAAERVFSSKISRDRLSAVVEKNKNGENITGDIVQFSSETGLSTDVIKQIIGVK